MALASFQLDPNHTHEYDKIRRIGCDSDWNNGTPVSAVVVYDGSQTVVGENNERLRYIGVKGIKSQTAPAG